MRGIYNLVCDTLPGGNLYLISQITLTRQWRGQGGGLGGASVAAAPLGRVEGAPKLIF
jgi:hypothetical protein